MMVVGKGVMDGRKANTVAYGVCTLIFVNLASGAPQQQPQINISNYYVDGKPASPGNQGWND